MVKKGDLSDSKCGTVVGINQAGVTISETADLGFSPTTNSRVYKQCSEKKKISSSLGESALLTPEKNGRTASSWQKSKSNPIKKTQAINAASDEPQQQKAAPGVTPAS